MTHDQIDIHIIDRMRGRPFLRSDLMTMFGLETRDAAAAVRRLYRLGLTKPEEGRNEYKTWEWV